jgi:exopolysaccharide biosynthesis polyprenyl glycosylphosphotransferase
MRTSTTSWRPVSGSLPELTTPPPATDPIAQPSLRIVAPLQASEAVAAPPRRLLRGRVRPLVLADVLAIELCLVAAYLIVGGWGTQAGASLWLTALLLCVLPVAWIGIFAAYQLYENRTRAIAPGASAELPRLFHALLTGSVLLLLTGEALEEALPFELLTPAHAALFAILALVAIPVMRGGAHRWSLAGGPRRVLIVGAGSTGRLLQRKLAAHPEYGVELVGFVDDVPTSDVVGPLHDLPVLVDRLEVDWVVVAGSDAPHERTVNLVREVRRPDVQLSIVPSFYELFASNAAMEDVEGVPVVSLPSVKLSRPLRMLKRSFDLCAATAALLALSPILIAIAIAIRLDSRGPVFFRQSRHGRNGGIFRIVKFRTMVDGAESQRLDMTGLNEMEGSGPLFKMKEDPRVTRVGAFLRRTSLDELPQLWNVLQGDMSLVGPRPFVVHESEQITGWASRRLDTTPGITGLWQVLGRNDIPFDEMVKLDYVYVTNWSLWWDIKILLQTIPVVLARRGAY